MKLLLKTRVERNHKEVFSEFNQALFEKLSPPLLSVKIDRFDGTKIGDEVHLKISLYDMLNMKWVSLITKNEMSENECYFVDEGKVLPAPLVNWHHAHRIQRIHDHASYIVDDIDYSSGNEFIDRLIYPTMYAVFYFRKAIYQSHFNAK